ncbi:MAG: dehydrogenase [Planctomycetes bacterium]|nr:dehydrogenase [Planctomycetota bacterium]
MDRVIARALVFACACAVSAPAQRGDEKDPPGTVQAPPPGFLSLPPSPPLPPHEELATFTVQDGFCVELVACEPMVEDPVAAVFDAHARLWVVEMRGFMPDADGGGESEPNGRIVVLADRDGDGAMDARTVFADGLALPRGVLPLGDGRALVLAPPSIWLFSDRDRDGVADERRDLGLEYPNGFSDPEHAANTPLVGPDGRIWFARWDRCLRIDGETVTSEPVAMGGQWGHAFDDAGRLVNNGNSDYLRGHPASPHYGVRHPFLDAPAFVNRQYDKDQEVWPMRITPGVNRGYQKGTLREDGRLWRFTAACAPLVYRGDWLAACTGDVFVCEPSAHFVRRAVLRPDGASLRGRVAEPQREFLASTDERFRPVNLADGPDGALYVVDLYRGVIQHKNYLTTYLRRQVDERGLASPIHLGRIWRVRPAAGERRRAVVVAERSAGELAALCEHDNGHVRDLAQQALVAARAKSAAPALRAQALHAVRAALRSQALWTLAGLCALDRGTLAHARDDADPDVRATAVRLTEPRVARGDVIAVIRVADAARGESAPRVAMQFALTLGATPRADTDLRVRAHVALVDLAVRFAGDPAVRDAVLSGLSGEELAFLARWSEDSRASAPRDEDLEFLRRLAQCVVRARDAGAITVLLERAVDRAHAGSGDALLRGVLDALPKKGSKRIAFAAEPETLARLRGSTDAFRRGVADRLAEAIDTSGAAAKDLDPASRAMLARGAAGYALHCAACHQPSGTGLDGLAPPLAGSEWVLGDPQVLTRLVLRGLTGPIEVAGRRFELPLMPDHARLSDDELAASLSHVRRAWDHEASLVDPDFVASQRKATAERVQPYTVRELQTR